MKKIFIFLVLFLASATFSQICGQIVNGSISNEYGSSGTVFGEIGENEINFSICSNKETFVVDFVIENGFYTDPGTVTISEGENTFILTNGVIFEEWTINLTVTPLEEQPVFENLQLIYCATGDTISLSNISSNGIFGYWEPAYSFVATGDTVLHFLFEAKWGECVKIANRIIYFEFVIKPCVNISGKVVYEDETALCEGLVELYYLTPPSQFSLVDTIFTENDGTYTFKNVQIGDYLIKAIPTIEEALPTYYGNTELWSEAIIVTVNSTSLYNKDITIISLSPLNGTSSIIGYVGTNNDGKKSISKSEISNPVPNVDVYLQTMKNSNWKTIAATLTNLEGYFKFNKVPIGTYRIIIDVAGLSMNNPPIVEITEDGEIIDDLEFKIDEDGINTLTINEILKEKIVLLYPNPTNGKLFIECKDFITVTIKIYDMFGKEVLNRDVSNKMELNINRLPQGVYNINIISDEKIIGNSKIVKQ